MGKSAKLLPFGMLVIGLRLATGQTDVSLTQAQDSSAASTPQQASASSPASPLSGIDNAGVESQTQGKWFFKPTVYGIQEVGSGVANEDGSMPVSSITRGYGGLLLDRKWKHYALGVGGLAGGTVFAANTVNTQAATQGIGQQAISWTSGRLLMLDFFSYLPEGSFGGLPFGGLGISGIALGNYLSLITSSTLNILNPSQFASFGSSPRLSNVAVVEADQRITRRSSITALAAYGTLQFFSQGLPNDQQQAAQLGYNYLLSPRSEIAFLGAYQNFGIAGISSAFRTQFANVIYTRQVSRRLSLTAGGGPVVSEFNRKFSLAGRQVSGMGLAIASYKLRSTRIHADFLSYVNGGSGYLLGAHTYRATLGTEHNFGVHWAGFLALGYARNDTLEQQLLLPSNLTARQGFGTGYVNLQLSRQLTPHLKAFALYNLNSERYNSTAMCSTTTCGLSATRQTGGVGVTWTPTERSFH
jgi:hypothetical protein